MLTADLPVGHVVRPPSSELLVVAGALDETVDSFLTQRNETAPDFKAAAALAALLRSLGFEKVTVVFEQPPAT